MPDDQALSEIQDYLTIAGYDVPLRSYEAHAPREAALQAAIDAIHELRRAIENPVAQPAWRLLALCDAAVATVERQAQRAASLAAARAGAPVAVPPRAQRSRD